LRSATSRATAAIQVTTPALAVRVLQEEGVPIG